MGGEPNDLIDDIFTNRHPDLKRDYYDCPFFAGPKDIDYNVLTKRDQKRLMNFLRKEWGYKFY